MDVVEPSGMSVRESIIGWEDSDSDSEEPMMMMMMELAHYEQIRDEVLMFKQRRNGRIPAIALGKEWVADRAMVDGVAHMPKWCTIIEGLGYEKMFPDPLIHPIKLAEDFHGVTWKGQFNIADRDDLPLARALDDEDGALNIIQECARVITSVYTNVWNTFQNYLNHGDPDPDLHTAMDRFRHVGYYKLHGKMEKRDNLPHFIPKNEKLGKDLLRCFLAGFGCHQGEAMLSFLEASIPNLKGKFCFTVRACGAEASKEPLSHGIPHCLVYGRSYEYHDHENPRRGRAKYRDIQIKRNMSRSRSWSPVGEDASWSRSRSCSPDGHDCFLLEDLKSRGDPAECGVFHSRVAVRRNPEDALIAQHPLASKYMEYHKPDIVCMHRSTPSRRGTEIELVVKITSASWFDMFEHGRRKCLLENIVNDSAFHCVWSCLASMQEGQTEILGLCCCIEGFKLLKIVKNDGHFRISETDLVLFSNYDQVVRLLNTLNAALTPV